MKNSNKIYIILLIFTLTSLFLVVLFVMPILQDIEKNSKDLTSAKDNIVALSAQTNETENFKNNYETYKPNLEKIDQLFVDPNNPVDFIEFLENTASSSQITSQISLPPSSVDSQPASQNFIIFQFASKGSFSDVLNFAEKIETGPYLIEIENLTIQDSEESTSGHSNISRDSSRKVDGAFTIKVFTKK